MQAPGKAPQEMGCPVMFEIYSLHAVYDSEDVT